MLPLWSVSVEILKDIGVTDSAWGVSGASTQAGHLYWVVQGAGEFFRKKG